MHTATVTFTSRVESLYNLRYSVEHGYLAGKRENADDRKNDRDAMAFSFSEFDSKNTHLTLHSKHTSALVQYSVSALVPVPRGPWLSHAHGTRRSGAHGGVTTRGTSVLIIPAPMLSGFSLSRACTSISSCPSVLTSDACRCHQLQWAQAV